MIRHQRLKTWRWSIHTRYGRFLNAIRALSWQTTIKEPYWFDPRGIDPTSATYIINKGNAALVWRSHKGGCTRKPIQFWFNGMFRRSTFFNPHTPCLKHIVNLSPRFMLPGSLQGACFLVERLCVRCVIFWIIYLFLSHYVLEQGCLLLCCVPAPVSV